MQELIALVKDLGPTSALVLGILMAFRRMLPTIELIMRRHLEAVDALERNSTKMSIAIEKIEELMEKTNYHLTSLDQRVDALARASRT